jgi:hypothetical protein
LAQLLGLLATILTLSACLPRQGVDAFDVIPSKAPAILAPAADELLASISPPLIENHGQVDSRVAYYLSGPSTSVYFTTQGLTLALSRAPEASGARERWAVAVDFVGARAVRPAAADPGETVVHDLRGKPDVWASDLPTYRRLSYPDLWPGIDLEYQTSWDALKYTFQVRPGADAGQIAFRYRGTSSVAVDAQGDLVVSTPVAMLRDRAPYVYQNINGQRATIPSAYRLERQDDTYISTIELGAYDQTLPLVVDPAVSIYSGFVGGLGWEEARAVAVDNDGYAYIVGTTIDSGTSFPTFVGPDTSDNGGGDVFVAKVRPDGSGLVYAGFIGGTGYDEGRGIAVDGAGSVYVTGYTLSSDFPSVGSSASYRGAGDAFVAKLKADGSGLAYSTLIGGTDFDEGVSIAVDGGGSTYVAGSTWSADGSFPVAVGPGLTFGGGNGDGFVAKVSPSGSALVYSGFIGGASIDEARAVAVDHDGAAYVTGYTYSSPPGFPTLVGPSTSNRGSGDAFVVKVRPNGDGLVYGGYLGGGGYDEGRAIAVGADGRAYVTGYTLSNQTSFPVRGGPDTTANGAGDVFVARIGAAGAIDYAGFIGGSGFDEGDGIAVGPDGSAYVTGATWSTDFPAVGLSRASTNNAQAILAKVAPDGTSLLLATAFGGDGEDVGYGIALDRADNVYLTGSTTSSEQSFPIKSGPSLSQRGGDAFVTKISLRPDLAIALYDLPETATVGVPVTFGMNLENRDTIGTTATEVRVSIGLPPGLELTSASMSQGPCQLQGASVICTLSTLASQGNATISIKVVPKSAGTLAIAATAASAEIDADPSNNVATATTTARVVTCTPRPNVTLSATPGAPGELVAVISATTSPGAPTNQLRTVQVGTPTNARVDVGGQTGLTTATTITLPPGTQRLSLTLHRLTSGRAATVPLTIVDDCGEWPTFVGGGPSAF